MSKKQALILFFLFDIPCLFILWYFPNEIGQLLLDTHKQADMVSFNSKEGFFILAIFVPIVHLLGFIEYFWFELIKKHSRLINYGAIVVFILLFVSAITISSLIKAKVENAGYMNCAELEWSGTYSVSYTYTRNQEICEQLVAEKAKEKEKRP
jgi:membrane protease YdiL (CAAX protease family)